jgi:hypothetical protein
MASPWQSGLAKLDDSLQPLQSQIDRLYAGLGVDDTELFHSLEEAQRSAAALHDSILAERPDLNWSDRQSLEGAIQQLEAAAHERVNQQRRNKLLDLANELEGGTVKHRVEARTTALNALRLEAVGELRSAAGISEQEHELPGPEAGEWLQWVSSLEEDKDAETFTYLRRNYANLERFAGELDERYWKPAPRPEKEVRPTVSQAQAARTEPAALPPQLDEIARELQADAAKSAAEAVAAKSASETTSGRNYRVGNATDGATSGPAMGDTPVTSTVNMFKVPSRKRSAAQAEETAKEPAVVESAASEPETVEPSSDESAEKMPSFGVLTQTRRPAAIWVAAVGGVVLCAVFAGLYHSSAKASSSPGGAPAKPDATNNAPAGSTAAAGADPSHSLAKQAVEGTQRQTALDLERCQRVNSGNIECWGYVSNVGTDPSRVSLQSVDVVDGKGNTFNLRGAGQLDFSTGRISNISGGAREKYTVTVPDKDPNAKTLTLYVDVTNPHALEYTFRDIPIT